MHASQSADMRCYRPTIYLDGRVGFNTKGDDFRSSVCFAVLRVQLLSGPVRAAEPGLVKHFLHLYHLYPQGSSCYCRTQIQAVFPGCGGTVGRTTPNCGTFWATPDSTFPILFESGRICLHTQQLVSVEWCRLAF